MSNKMCEKCGKNFSTKSNLKQHQIVCLSDNLLKCYECGVEFAKKNLLRQHIKNVHRVGKEFFECCRCSKTFSHEKTLRRHIKTIHMVQGNILVCEKCGKHFSNNYNLNRHQKTVHGEQIEMKTECFRTIENFECDKCKKKFMRKDVLQAHIKVCFMIDRYYWECPVCFIKCSHKRALEGHKQSFHNNDKEKRVKKIKCPLCQQPFYTSRMVEKHLEENHNINLIYESLELESVTEFDSFMKKDPFVQFFITAEWQTKTYNARIFRCHRSGAKPIKIIERKRCEKFGGSKKLDCFCPGSITAKQRKSNGTFAITWQKVHVGHSLSEEELLYKTLNLSEKMIIANRLSLGVLSNTVPGQHQTNKHNESHLDPIKYHDIMNVAKKTRLNKRYQGLFDDDILNIQVFIEENKDMVLFFKPEGQPDTEFSTLMRKDFVFILMNEMQEKFLRLYGRNVVAFDETHRINPNELILHTMLVLDVNREGLPVAFLIANRNDKTVVDIFLECVKKRIGGVVTTNTIMSDMQSSYHKSWQERMGPVQHLLYCIWHVFQACQKNLSKVDKSKRKYVRSKIYDMAYEVDKEVFEQKLNKFLTETDSTLQSFIQYFRTNYVSCRKYWAYSYRQCSGINTNMHVESFHHTLKNRLWGREKVPSLYGCLCSLNDYLQILNYNTAVTKICGTIAQAQNNLRHRHVEAKNCEKVFVKCISETVWQVGSFRDNDDDVQEMYTVQKCVVKKCTLYTDIECQLRCPSCKVCYHEFSCSCIDCMMKNNMCKHIHLIILRGLYRPTTPNICASADHPVIDLDQGNADGDQNYNLGIGAVSEIGNCDNVDGRPHSDNDLNTYKKKAMQEFVKTLQKAVHVAASNEDIEGIRESVNSAAVTAEASNFSY